MQTSYVDERAALSSKVTTLTNLARHLNNLPGIQEAASEYAAHIDKMQFDIHSPTLKAKIADMDRMIDRETRFAAETMLVRMNAQLKKMKAISSPIIAKSDWIKECIEFWEKQVNYISGKVEKYSIQDIAGKVNYSIQDIAGEVNNSQSKIDELMNFIDCICNAEKASIELGKRLEALSKYAPNSDKEMLQDIWARAKEIKKRIDKIKSNKPEGEITPIGLELAELIKQEEGRVEVVEKSIIEDPIRKREMINKLEERLEVACKQAEGLLGNAIAGSHRRIIKRTKMEINKMNEEVNILEKTQDELGRTLLKKVIALHDKLEMHVEPQIKYIEQDINKQMPRILKYIYSFLNICSSLMEHAFLKIEKMLLEPVRMLIERF